jgi:hypothetical protein
VAAALSRLKPHSAGEFTVRVIDPQIPENEGPWRVYWRDPRVVVEKISSEADLTLDIQAFSQAFMGEPSLREVAEQGRVEIRSAKALQAAELLLPPLAVYCGDFF